MSQSLAELNAVAELKEAARLVEKAAFDLAEKMPSVVIAELIKAAADIERVLGEITPCPVRVN